MSWIERIQNNFEITCGDGSVFRPNWMKASKVLTFNIKEFNFPGVQGTLVDRREAQGRKFDLEIFFQGDDHLDISDAFETSSLDKRFWTISHPMYGQIIVQPSSLSFDNTVHNITKITGTVTETITITNPKPLIIPEDKIDEDTENLNEVIAVNFTNNVEPKSSDITTAKATNEKVFQETNNEISNDIDGQTYFNALNSAQTSVTESLTDVDAAIRQTTAFILAPARFSQSVKSRLDMLGRNFETLRLNISGTLSKIPKTKKQYYESNAASTLSAMALASSIKHNDDDYKNRPQVVEIIQFLLAALSQYLQDLDTLQTGTGNNPSDYVPNAQTIINLNNLFNYTVGNLFQIGLNARQERFYVTPENTNLIELCHVIYGLKDADESINELIRNNGFGLFQMLEIKKDTKIVYYI